MADSALSKLLDDAAMPWPEKLQALVDFDYKRSDKSSDDNYSAPNPNDDTPMPVAPDTFDVVACDRRITDAQYEELVNALDAKINGGQQDAAPAGDAPAADAPAPDASA